MIYKSLILGVLFSIGIFAVKSGVGFAYVLERRKGLRAAAAVLIFASAYGLIFGLAALFLKRFDPVRFLPAFQTFIQSGMLVHVGMAALMMVWGWALLKRPRSRSAQTRGWLILVLPCPVCATVVLLSLGFLLSLLPDHFGGVVCGLYTAFMLLSMLAAWALRRSQKALDQPSETLLGGAMLLIAAWFLLSVTIFPQFADLDKIYRLATYQSGRQAQTPLTGLWPAILTGASFALGYGFTYKKIRKLS